MDLPENMEVPTTNRRRLSQTQRRGVSANYINHGHLQLGIYLYFGKNSWFQVGSQTQNCFFTLRQRTCKVETVVIETR